MFLFMNGADLLLGHEKLDWFIPVNALFWLAAGYGVGLSMWNLFERKFNRIAR